MDVVRPVRRQRRRAAGAGHRARHRTLRHGAEGDRRERRRPRAQVAVAQIQAADAFQPADQCRRPGVDPRPGRQGRRGVRLALGNAAQPERDRPGLFPGPCRLDVPPRAVHQPPLHDRGAARPLDDRAEPAHRQSRRRFRRHRSGHDAAQLFLQAVQGGQHAFRLVLLHRPRRRHRADAVAFPPDRQEHPGHRPFPGCGSGAVRAVHGQVAVRRDRTSVRFQARRSLPHDPGDRRSHRAFPGGLAVAHGLYRLWLLHPQRIDPRHGGRARPRTPPPGARGKDAVRPCRDRRADVARQPQAFRRDPGGGMAPGAAREQAGGPADGRWRLL